MGAENPNPLDELKSLDEQIDSIANLADLKPIFFRLDEIGKQYPGDFDVQLAAADVKQHLVNRGKQLKSAASVPEASASAPPPLSPDLEPPGAPAPPPPLPQGAPTTPRTPVRPPSQPSSQPAWPPLNWKRALWVGALAGAGIAIIAIVLLVNLARKRNVVDITLSGGVPVEIVSVPPGAAVRINGEQKCTSNCNLRMAPGNYQVTAFLDGYEPAASGVTVATGQPASVNLTLEPQAQSVRILTDLDQGKVVFDDGPPADLQEGQFILDKVPPGAHTVKVTGKTGDASFSFEIANAKAPAVTGTVTTHNLVAVLVSSLGNQARVVTNSGPTKLALNGQPQGDAGPAGLDLKNFLPGVDEIVVGEGKDQRNMKESFGPAPTLTAFLKSDLNIGTLIVSTGEDDVRVFLNDKEYPRKTKRGQLRVRTIGNVAVRVAKDGFQTEPAQTAEVKKGSEVRLEFKLKALPQVAGLQIRGGTPGAEVLIDNKSVGAVAGDGNFNYNTVEPGDRAIEIRREQYTPKKLQRTFRAGQTVVLSGGDAILAAAAVNGTIRLARAPAEASVSYRRADENQAHEVRGNQVELPAGNYIFTARAPGFADRSERVQVAGGETRTLEFALARERPVVTAPKAGGIDDFEDPGAWKKDGDLFVHKGGGFVPYKLPANGVFTFTVELLKGGSVFRGGRIRWCVNYTDSKNYALYELDRKNFWAKVVEKGETFERGRTQHDLEKQKSFTIQLEVTPQHIVHKLLNGDQWIVLDTWAEPGRNFSEGKFGFLIRGNDEIGISDFKFQPK